MQARRYALIPAVLAFVAAFAMGDAAAQSERSQIARRQGGGIPIAVTGSDNTSGTFAGTFYIKEFVRRGSEIHAIGTLTGTLSRSGGTTQNVVTQISAPVDLGASSTPAEFTAQQAACEILHLELGPLDLDLLGLVVHLDRIVLDISAEPGAGNLLGNLLCAIAGLLDPGGNLGRIVDLLNRIIDILG